MKKLIVLIILSGTLFVSCKTSAVTDFNKIKQIISSNTWVLQDENGGVVGFNGKDVTMTFHEDNGLKAGGFAGCNNYFASVDLLPDRVSFGQAGSTMMACPEMDGEQAFLDLLTQINGYEIAGNELKFYQNKILLLRFKAK